MTSPSLTDFLLARIAEDEEVANATVNLTGRDGWWVDGPSLESSKYWVYATGENFTDRPIAEHIARHDPASVLAECEAKRRIVEAWPKGDATDTAAQAVGARAMKFHVLQQLALPYADHPDYRQEWRP